MLYSVLGVNSVQGHNAIDMCIATSWPSSILKQEVLRDKEKGRLVNISCLIRLANALLEYVFEDGL